MKILFRILLIGVMLSMLLSPALVAQLLLILEPNSQELWRIVVWVGFVIADIIGGSLLLAILADKI